MPMVALLRAGVNRGHQQRTIDADGVHRADTISSPLADGDPCTGVLPAGVSQLVRHLPQDASVDRREPISKSS
jgi:phosphopantothenate synthetase